MNEINISIGNEEMAFPITPDQIVTFLKMIRNYIGVIKNFAPMFSNSAAILVVLVAIEKFIDNIIPLAGEPWFANMLAFFMKLFQKQQQDSHHEVAAMLASKFA